MDQVSEQRLALVWPTLATSIRIMAANLLVNENMYIRVVQGLRTIAEQDALYAQGRTAPGPEVTNARGGYSWHNFGVAVDCVPSSNPTVFTPIWDPANAAYEKMQDEGIKQGLTSGARWISRPDAPHFQLTGQYPYQAPTDANREFLAANSLEAFWATIQI